MRAQQLMMQVLVLLTHVHIRCCSAHKHFSAAHAGKPLPMLARNRTSARSAAGAGAGGGWYKDSGGSNGRSRAVISSFAATAPFSCATILVRTLPAPIFYCLGAKVILGFPPIWDFSGHLFNSFPAACDFKQIFYSACLLSFVEI